MNTIRLLAAALLLGASVATAQSVWKTDKSHSNVKFTVSHLVVAEVGGRFTDFDATVTHTKDDLSDMVVEAVIKTASINTDNEQRDTHLRGDDFLNAEKFPDMKFKSTKVEKTGKDTYRITGDLTIRNVTKPVVLDTRFGGVVKDPWGNTKSAFRATTTIDRFAWDVKWNKAIETGGLVVGKDVEITLLFEFAKQS
jgi:polyisoprenoid-binding protein YceI